MPEIPICEKKVGAAKVCDEWVMSLKPLEVRVSITELPTLVEKKSKQMDLNNTPEPMSLPINDLPYPDVHEYTHIPIVS